jgi:hypothetical protein
VSCGNQNKMDTTKTDDARKQMTHENTYHDDNVFFCMERRDWEWEVVKTCSQPNRINIGEKKPL